MHLAHFHPRAQRMQQHFQQYPNQGNQFFSRPSFPGPSSFRPRNRLRFILRFLEILLSVLTCITSRKRKLFSWAKQTSLLTSLWKSVQSTSNVP